MAIVPGLHGVAQGNYRTQPWQDCFSFSQVTQVFPDCALTVTLVATAQRERERAPMWEPGELGLTPILYDLGSPSLSPRPRPTHTL